MVEDVGVDGVEIQLRLDTVTGDKGERLYLRLGWQRVGVIPGYALLPRGGLVGTTVFYRELA